eukprot:CAMPEP_0114235532 /NCGR_PEP_ID=MMETSP0058-20121206/6301_1 /TAXON_ID=36894 /ORGANISM="Pyramimonas parkeae, CCMP726" /LENGTH=393 /DNA_ID=CAMNT_0001347301 /DNA_START=108 /DNA_END=1289 /DNA_ORIENTATION=+
MFGVVGKRLIGLGVMMLGLRSAMGVSTLTSAPALESRMRGAMLGALVADALTLGTHYEYDAVKIKQFYGSIDTYYAPGQKTGGQTHGVGWGARNFHNGNGNGPPKKAGEQTDYGDYNLLMLKHLANTADNPRRIQLNELLPFWSEELKTWRSWICTQTRQTLQQVNSGFVKAGKPIGGMSNAMAIRHAAAYSYYDNEEDVVHAARTTMFTHRETSALEGGEFFARVTFRIIHAGLTPRQAIVQVAEESSPFIRSKVQQALDKVAEATDPDKPLSREEFVDDLALTSMARLWDVGKSEPIKVGKASPTEGTLPGAIYFILKYDGDFGAAAKANAEVGGDNASRSIAIGMVMGAAQGLEGIPSHLGKGKLVEWQTTQDLLSKMPLLKQGAPKADL